MLHQKTWSQIEDLLTENKFEPVHRTGEQAVKYIINNHAHPEFGMEIVIDYKNRRLEGLKYRGKIPAHYLKLCDTIKESLALDPAGTIYVTSDTHFFHDAIIKHCRSNYATIDEMHEDIINTWNLVVPKDGIVLHLGDFAMNPEKHVDELKTIMSRLNGTKILLLGNHDKNVFGHNRHLLNEIGFKNVENVRSIQAVSSRGNRIIFSHEPLEIHEGWRGQMINIHGHIHTGVSSDIFASDPQRINVCWDVMKKPIKLKLASEDDLKIYDI